MLVHTAEQLIIICSTAWAMHKSQAHRDAISRTMRYNSDRNCLDMQHEEYAAENRTIISMMLLLDADRDFPFGGTFKCSMLLVITNIKGLVSELRTLP